MAELQRVRRDVMNIYIDVLDRIERGILEASRFAQEREELEFLRNLEAKILLAQTFASELFDEYDPVSAANLFTAMDVISEILQNAREIPIARRFFGRIIGE